MIPTELLSVPHCEVRPLQGASNELHSVFSLDEIITVGTKTLQYPVASPFTNTTIAVESIYDILYGELHFFPSTSFEMGNVYQDQIESVYLWNATDSTVTFEETEKEHSDGSALELSVEDLPSLSSREGTLYVYKSGPSSTDATYTIHANLRDIVLSVTASRVVILPFLPDWGHDISMGYAFETVLEQNFMLNEQRRPLTYRPLRKTSFAVMEGDEVLQLARNLAVYGDGKTFLVPIFSEPILLDAASSSTLSASCDISGHWNLTRLCQIVVIYNRITKTAVGLEITAVNPDARTITLSRDLSNPVTAADVVVFPAFIGTIGSFSASALTSEYGAISFGFDELAGEDQPDLGDIADQPDYFPFDADWATEPEIGCTALQTITGYSGTAQGLYSRGVLPPMELEEGFTLLSRDESASFLDFFCTKKGRSGTFFIRGPHREFTLTDTVLPDDGQLNVRDNGFGSIFSSDKTCRIYVVGDDGTIYDRTITAVSSGSDGEIVLGLDTTLGATVSDSAFVGRTYLARFGDDEISIENDSDMVSKTSSSFFELIHEDI